MAADGDRVDEVTFHVLLIFGERSLIVTAPTSWTIGELKARKLSVSFARKSVRLCLRTANAFAQEMTDIPAENIILIYKNYQLADDMIVGECKLAEVLLVRLIERRPVAPAVVPDADDAVPADAVPDDDAVVPADAVPAVVPDDDAVPADAAAPVAENAAAAATFSFYAKPLDGRAIHVVADNDATILDLKIALSVSGTNL